MFYPKLLLTKNSSGLAKLWLAAHWEKKLSKSAVFETDLEKTVDVILESRSMSLRLSGHLLFGTVKMQQKKAIYLMEDIKEAIAKLKVTFTNIALPSAITLPPQLINFDTEMFGHNGDLQLNLVSKHLFMH